MSDIYQHEPHKFATAGLQLRVPVDLVPSLQYSRLTNGVPVIEGRIEGRAGLNFIVGVANATSPGSGLHTLKRLNQASISTVGDRVAGVDTSVQTFALPAGNVATSRDVNRTGDPISLSEYPFSADTAAWAVLSDRQGMQKYRGGTGAGYYGPLGEYAPQNAVQSQAAGAAGNLNNTGGPNYDWVYTHVFTPTLSESNPSQPTFNGEEQKNPTATTTPEAGFGGSAATAIGATTGTLNALSSTETRQSGSWQTWAAAASQPYQLLFLNIQGSFVVTGTSGTVYGAIYFSVDGGTTWKLFVECSSGTLNFGIPPNPIGFGTIQLNPNQDLAQLRVRAVVMGCGNLTASQNVIARRIRDRAGNFTITDLLVGANATNRAMALTISDIHTLGVPVGATVANLALTNQQANLCIVDPRNLVPTFLVDAINLYRRGGSVAGGWAFSQQFRLSTLAQGICGAGQLQVNDNVADGNLGSFVTFLNDSPVTSVYVLQRPLPYMWGPGFNPARMFGCGDPDRPNAVYFSNPGNADQWGVGQWLAVSSPSDPMQNGCVYNTRVFAFSKEKMFEIAPSLTGGSTFTPFQTPCQRGLISPWGLVATAKTIYFVAKDGVYATTGGEEQSLVENDIKPLFPTLDYPQGRQVESYDSVNMERIEDIRLRIHNDELYFIYRGSNTGNLQYLVFDQMKRRWRAAAYPVAVTTIYSEEATQSSLLFGDSTGSMYNTIGTGGDVLAGGNPNITTSIRTGAFDQGTPLNLKEYGSVLFDLDPGGATVASPVTITPLLNGEAITQSAITVTGTGRQQVPLALGDVFGFNIEFDITFTKSASINPVLFQFDILWRLEPAAVTHWEARETSHGLPGFQHLRDIYLPIRSQQQLTLTLTFDSSYTQTYTVASTNNQRLKLYLPLNSNKFKLVRYSLDQTSTDITKPFRIYEADLEVRAKPWLTSLGYMPLKPFGGEATQVSEMLASELLGGK